MGGEQAAWGHPLPPKIQRKPGECGKYLDELTSKRRAGGDSSVGEEPAVEA